MSLKKLRDARRQRLLGETSIQEQRILRKHRYNRFNGVGDALEFIIRNRFNAHVCGSCVKSKNKMNEKGVNWCRVNIEELAKEIHENVQHLSNSPSSRWIKMKEWLTYETTGLHFHKQLINEAINLYETTLAESERTTNEPTGNEGQTATEITSGPDTETT